MTSFIYVWSASTAIILIAFETRAQGFHQLVKGLLEEIVVISRRHRILEFLTAVILPDL
jgi:hypothetical protein